MPCQRVHGSVPCERLDLACHSISMLSMLDSGKCLQQFPSLSVRRSATTPDRWEELVAKWDYRSAAITAVYLDVPGSRFVYFTNKVHSYTSSSQKAPRSLLFTIRVIILLTRLRATLRGSLCSAHLWPWIPCLLCALFSRRRLCAAVSTVRTHHSLPLCLCRIRNLRVFLLLSPAFSVRRLPLLHLQVLPLSSHTAHATLFFA